MAQRHTRTAIGRRIGDLAEEYGWRHHHNRCPGLTRDGYVDGFPGQVLVRDGCLLFLTIASSTGRLTRRQTAWLDELNAIWSVEVHVIQRDDPRSITRALRPRRVNPARERKRSARP